MRCKGYAYATDKAALDALPASATKVFGLFGPSHMSYELDRDATKEPSLAEMSVKAVDVLAKNPRGFFLMVEGGRIDHALHETNAAEDADELLRGGRRLRGRGLRRLRGRTGGRGGRAPRQPRATAGDRGKLKV